LAHKWPGIRWNWYPSSSRSEIGSYRKKIPAATRPEREEDEPDAKEGRKEEKKVRHSWRAGRQLMRPGQHKRRKDPAQKSKKMSSSIDSGHGNRCFARLSVPSIGQLPPTGPKGGKNALHQ
jgi:hypothetical protein